MREHDDRDAVGGGHGWNGTGVGRASSPVLPARLRASRGGYGAAMAPRSGRRRHPHLERERADRALPRDARRASSPASTSTCWSSTAARPTPRSRSPRPTAPGCCTCAPRTSTTPRALNVGLEEVEGDVILLLSGARDPGRRALDRATCWRRSPTRRSPVSRVARCRGTTRRGTRCAASPRRSGACGACSAPGTDPEEILFSNAASAVRRSAWRALPFTLPAAEDLDWARRVVAGGGRIVLRARRGGLPLPRARARAPGRCG